MPDAKMSTIMVIDDNEPNLEVLANILFDNGYKLILDTSGQEAFESLQVCIPDLILLDIMMPEMDGFQICKRLKGDEKTKEIPVIFLTAKTEIEDLAKGFSMGAVDYVTKPFRKEELLARVKTHIELRNALRISKELIRMKDKLFSIIAHDLRGPIGNFMTVMDFITDKEKKLSIEKMQIFLQELKYISQNAFALLENLLNWAKSQQKLIKFVPSDHKIRDLVEENIELLSGIAKTKSISLTHEFNGTLTACFDKDTISIVIRNLISNALKFTNSNGEIKVTAIELNNFLQISVKDTGIGMSSENINRLFKQDQIFSTFGTNNEKGSGLGLLLCKDFVEGNGGKIWVESETGKGSNFKFTLPKFQFGS